MNQLCHDRVATMLRETLEFYQARGDWLLIACVVMPDHLHLLVRPSPEVDLPRLITALKRYTARFGGIRWKRNYFDRWLRRTESLAGKIDYLGQNPVRANLCGPNDRWPYFWRWHPDGRLLVPEEMDRPDGSLSERSIC